MLMLWLLCCVLCVSYLSCVCVCFFFFFKQKTAYEMRISDWSSDVCSSDLRLIQAGDRLHVQPERPHETAGLDRVHAPWSAGQRFEALEHVSHFARRVRPGRGAERVARLHVQKPMENGRAHV